MAQGIGQYMGTAYCSKHPGAGWRSEDIPVHNNTGRWGLQGRTNKGEDRDSEKPQKWAPGKIDGSDRQLFVTKRSRIWKTFPDPELKRTRQRHPHQKLLFTLCNSIWKSVSVKRFQFWSQIAKQNKKGANKNLYFLSFQQKGKPEEFCIGLTISLGLCPMQNKKFHFMPGLIETSKM